MQSHGRCHENRSFATILALWAIAIAAIVLVTLQSSAWRQAAAGREDLAHIRAKWAARAGIEACIASLAADTQNPDSTSAYTTMDDMAEVSNGVLSQASYSVRHSVFPNEEDGPEDAGSKININRMTKEDFLTFLDMSESEADAILDWKDEDDDVMELGAEEGTYIRAKPFSYKPRNAPMRTLQELELVVNVDPTLVRGEDWNLNGRLDPNEDDSDASWPPDNADGRLDAGWSAHLTTYSTDGGLALSGKPKLDIRTASASEIQQRFDLDKDQSDAVAAYSAGLTATMANFLVTDLATLARQANGPQNARQARALTDDQLALLLDEGILEDSTATTVNTAGKLNINTCTKETLEHVAGIESALADLIILERDARAQGFVSLVDLLEVPAISRQRLSQLMGLLTVRSNVFVVHSAGRDETSGLVVEITAVLDRSSLPIVIKDYVVH